MDGELWRTDGTATGTILLASPPGGIDSYTIANDMFFFVSFDWSSGWTVWKSDGTTEGTSAFPELIPEEAHSSQGGGITNVNGAVFFAANDGKHGQELWILKPGDPADPGDTDPVKSDDDSGDGACFIMTVR